VAISRVKSEDDIFFLSLDFDYVYAKYDETSLNYYNEKFRPVSQINSVMKRMGISEENFREMTLRDFIQTMIDKRSNWLEFECRT
jgi:hypothetical protein